MRPMPPIMDIIIIMLIIEPMPPESPPPALPPWKFLAAALGTSAPNAYSSERVPSMANPYLVVCWQQIEEGVREWKQVEEK